MTYRWLSDLDLALITAGITFTPVGASPNDPTGAGDWRSRGRPASTGCYEPAGVLCHHTASPAGTSDESDLAVILRGNAEAPGPISALYIGRTGTVFLVAAGRCNHGGKGRRPGVDTGGCEDMNCRLLGIEAGNDGVGERWPDIQVDIYGRVVAALCDWYGWPLEAVYLHATTGPPDGGCNSKIDPAGPWLLEPDLPGGAGGTWNLDTWRGYCGSTAAQPIPGGNELVHTLIRVRNSYVVLAGDMDAQGVIQAVRWVGPGLNQSIGFEPDNVTPRLAGTQVLERDQADLATISLIGPVPAGDLLTWSPATFYQGA